MPVQHRRLGSLLVNMAEDRAHNSLHWTLALQAQSSELRAFPPQADEKAQIGSGYEVSGNVIKPPVLLLDICIHDYNHHLGSQAVRSIM